MKKPQRSHSHASRGDAEGTLRVPNPYIIQETENSKLKAEG
ncbi:Uncharacterized protein dnm_022390 [Desulfonema magnum]|uniref:Uncharacterized protein n=1 Tax=Desulfonema magnum TaxID=45655 RepID=A0A975GMV6_9BACT|nr:Uncharacterized protein dnm_022390 [Desulfonema magnum]